MTKNAEKNVAEKDVDKLEKLAFTLNGLVEIGEEIFKDGKVNLADMAQLGPLALRIKELVDLRNDLAEMKSEFKNANTAQALKVIQALLG